MNALGNLLKHWKAYKHAEKGISMLKSLLHALKNVAMHWKAYQSTEGSINTLVDILTCWKVLSHVGKLANTLRSLSTFETIPQCTEKSVNMLKHLLEG